MRLKNKAFSLIIPARNAELTIKKCIISALKADVAPKEIIIVDDFSDDETKECLQSLLKSNKKKIKLISLNKNVGPSEARDIGTKFARETIYVFADSDTVFLKNTFRSFLDTIMNFNADAVSGIYHPEPSNSGLVQLYKASFFYYQFSRHKKPFPYQTFNGQLGAIKSRVYKDVGGYNKKIKWGMDYENEEFGRRIIKKYSLYLDPNFQVKHEFPGFIKLTFTYFTRVSSWILVFMKDFKFESGGPAAKDSGIASFSILCLILSLVLSLYDTVIFSLAFCFFFFLWLRGYLSFFKYIYHKKSGFLIWAILFNIWFSFVISLGAFWGFIRWLRGQRAL